jgi:uncharacterized SAM-binding protein YcdF (DUF218 family)
MLPGGAGDGIDAVSKLSQDYPNARLTFCGFRAADKNLIRRLADLGVDPARINIESQSRTTSEDAHYSAALLRPKPGERWLLITAAMHMPRAVNSNDMNAVKKKSLRCPLIEIRLFSRPNVRTACIWP